MWWQNRITSNFFKWQVAWSINSSDILFQFLPIPVVDLFSVNLYSLEKGFDWKQWSTAISEDHICHTYHCKALWTESIRCSETHHQCILFQCSVSPLVWSDCNICYQRYIFFEYYKGHILFSVYSSCHVGEVPLSVHESAVELLLHAHKLITVVRTTSEAMRAILVRHLYQDLEGVKQDDVQRLTKVQVITMH